MPPGLDPGSLPGLPGREPLAPTFVHGAHNPFLDPSLTWDVLPWLVGESKLPVIVKGVLRADDAVRALERGAAAVAVSNHGGRNLDTVPATIDVLPRIVAAGGGRGPGLFRRG